MAIETVCPKCKKKTRSPDRTAGKDVPCASCGVILHVPKKEGFFSKAYNSIKKSFERVEFTHGKDGEGSKESLTDFSEEPIIQTTPKKENLPECRQSTINQTGGKRYEYHVDCFTESAIWKILLGEANMNTEKIQERFNIFGQHGWRVVTVEREMQQVLLFWQREAFITFFIREVY